MPAYIDFYTGLWSEKWFRESHITVKVVFPFLWTNDNKNSAGMYRIDTGLIAFKLGMDENEVDSALQWLNDHERIQYDPDEHLVWVKNHVKHQYLKTGNIAPKQAMGLEKAIYPFKDHQFYNDFHSFYPEIRNAITKGIESHTKDLPKSTGKGKGKGEVKVKGSEIDNEVKKSKEVSPDCIEKMKAKYPQFDIPANIESFYDYIEAHGKKYKSYDSAFRERLRNDFPKITKTSNGDGESKDEYFAKTQKAYDGCLKKAKKMGDDMEHYTGRIEENKGKYFILCSIWEEMKRRNN